MGMSGDDAFSSALGILRKYVKDTMIGAGAIKGDSGESAFEIAVANGFSGTQKQWLNSLKGRDGDNGISAYQVAVANGFSGTQAQWLASLKGSNGDDGASAYEIAVENGFSGTEAEWLASLKGADGTGGGGGSVTSEYAGKNAIGFGTSITNLCSKASNGGGYLKVVQDKLGLATYVNAGFSGYGIAKTTNTESYSIVYQVKHTSLSNYDLVTIEGCTNDFAKNVVLGDVGIIGDTNFDESTFCGALRSAIEYVLTNRPQAKLLLITDPQRNYHQDELDVNATNRHGLKLVDYVNAMNQVGALYGVPVCDWYHNSGFNKFTERTYTSDGLHPNLVGYKRLGELVIGALAGSLAVISSSESDEPVAKTLSSITAVKTTTSYQEGDTLSTNDIVVTAHYSDNTTANVTSSATINTSNVNMSNAGTYTISVSYTENGVTKTTTITITVTTSGVTPTPKTLSSITATKTVTTYVEGETLATNDIDVTANYSDGTSDTVTSLATIDATDVDTSAEGTYTISISYTENGVTKTTSITITVESTSQEEEVTSVTIDGVTYDISAAVGWPYKMIMSFDDDIWLYGSQQPFVVGTVANPKEMFRKPSARGSAENNAFANFKQFTVGADDGVYKSLTGVTRTLDQYLWTNHDLVYVNTTNVAVPKS